MKGRTDLAIETIAEKPPTHGKLRRREYKVGETSVQEIEIVDAAAEAEIGRKIGKYYTVDWNETAKDADVHTAVRDILREFTKNMKNILVLGLGNEQITPDALGPKTAARVLATRHIEQDLAESIGLRGLSPVAVLAPGVLGQTGIEVLEIIKGTAQRVHPGALIVVDALAAAELPRLCRTIQICNTGISPGSGVGNSRKEISQDSMGIPVIALGVPTVVDLKSIVNSRDNMIVTHRDIDMRIDKASELLAHAINCALQPALEEEVLRNIV